LLLLHDLYSANFEDRVRGAGVARWRTWLTGEGEKVRFRWCLKEPIEGECEYKRQSDLSGEGVAPDFTSGYVHRLHLDIFVFQTRRSFGSWLCYRQQCTYIHCVSKNIPDVFSYNSRKHSRIFIIFGRNNTKKASNQKMLYFPTSPN